jgi:hypothetical protein
MWQGMFMELAIILMMLLIVVAVGAIKLNEPGLAFPFKKNTTLFTQVERTFLNLIEEAVGKQFKVLCRVKLNDVVTLRQNADKKTAQAAVSRASNRHLDFVLCSKEDMTPVIAIDLVHNMGKEGYKSQRDWFVSGALDAARIPHVRIKVKSGYKVKDIRECIEAKLAVQKQPQSPPIIKGTNNPDNLAAKRPTRPLHALKPRDTAVI